LKHRGDAEHREARGHHPDALTRSDNRRIDQAVRVSVLAVMVAVALVVGLD
jgi:hypothetical protein